MSRVRQSERDAKTARLVQLTITGMSVERAAEQLGIPRRTASDLLRTPLATQLLTEAHREIMQRTAHTLVSANLAALQSLVRAMHEAPRWADRIAAARTIAMLGTRQQVEVVGAGGGPVQVESVDELDGLIEAASRRLKALDVIDVDEAEAV